MDFFFVVAWFELKEYCWCWCLFTQRIIRLTTETRLWRYRARIISEMLTVSFSFWYCSVMFGLLTLQCSGVWNWFFSFCFFFVSFCDTVNSSSFFLIKNKCLLWAIGGQFWGGQMFITEQVEDDMWSWCWQVSLFCFVTHCLHFILAHLAYGTLFIIISDPWRCSPFSCFWCHISPGQKNPKLASLSVKKNERKCFKHLKSTFFLHLLD